VHLPTHLGKKAPHAWQLNWVVGFAIGALGRGARATWAGA
jgi:hypothetical protein